MLFINPPYSFSGDYSGGEFNPTEFPDRFVSNLRSIYFKNDFLHYIKKIAQNGSTIRKKVIYVEISKFRLDYYGVDCRGSEKIYRHILIRSRKIKYLTIVFINFAFHLNINNSLAYFLFVQK